ncbi:cysteine-rich KTR domain-containing protein [Lachnospiraceae bacterium 29-91]
MQKENMKWLLCPLCGNKTRNKIREDTILKNYPLYCPKCKQEVLIEVKDLQVTIIKEPDALDAEPMNGKR